MKYELFLLDADNTLYDYDAAEAEALNRVLTERGIHYHDGVLSEYRRINRGLWDALETKAITADELKVERFARLLASLGPDASGKAGDLKAFSERYLYFLSKCSLLIDGAEEVCAELIRRGGKLVLFTNGLTAVQRPRVAASPIADMFTALAINEELGVQKPDPRMVDIAMKMAGHKIRETTLIVGDSQKADIGAAVNAGVDSCWIGGAPDDALPMPTYVISHIRKLLDIV